ncbi:uncharacterized protein LOC122510777 isoform X1 [Leptopilina heterotoma]|uniref:uncharacterized protein LOC122510777 isoform X1 n=1 Tax=Leptopilina heterotoma TaxID=63436 RepID=UPI001CA8B17B|nr:uncharacterized protein LOC122510777 isoform X1 [Leptopilina heterotoma]
MTFPRRQETSRILSRRKGSVCSKGGGNRTLSRCLKDGSIIPVTWNNRLIQLSSELPTTSWDSHFLIGTSNGQAACMIIEDNPPLPTRSRQTLHQDTTQRFLNLVLPKHRTTKFSSNRHRKLQPFRET